MWTTPSCQLVEGVYTSETALVASQTTSCASGITARTLPRSPRAISWTSSEKGARNSMRSGGTGRPATRSGVLEPVQIGEHLGGVRGDVRHLVRLADDPVGVDEVA